MRRTRVVVADMPGMLGDIVRDAVTGEPDMELVADVSTREEAPAAITDRRADVLILGREASESEGPGLDLLCGCLDTTVFVVTKDGRRAFRYELHAAEVPLTAEVGGISPQHLLGAIRQAGRRRAPEPGG